LIDLEGMTTGLDTVAAEIVSTAEANSYLDLAERLNQLEHALAALRRQVDDELIVAIAAATSPLELSSREL
jgi:hypothetical protein